MHLAFAEDVDTGSTSAWVNNLRVHSVHFLTQTDSWSHAPRTMGDLTLGARLSGRGNLTIAHQLGRPREVPPGFNKRLMTMTGDVNDGEFNG